VRARPGSRRAPAHRRGGHEALGNRPEALSAFHRLKAQLREDLGVSPSAETEALFTRICGAAGARRPAPGAAQARASPRARMAFTMVVP